MTRIVLLERSNSGRAGDGTLLRIDVVVEKEWCRAGEAVDGGERMMPFWSVGRAVRMAALTPSLGSVRTAGALIMLVVMRGAWVAGSKVD